ncbi:MAG: hypothetical protein E6I51_11700, partial [Chloroflexi bacterium]
MDESERTEGEPEAAHEPPKAANEGGGTPPPPQSPGGGGDFDPNRRRGRRGRRGRGGGGFTGQRPQFGAPRPQFGAQRPPFGGQQFRPQQQFPREDSEQARELGAYERRQAQRQRGGQPWLRGGSAPRGAGGWRGPRGGQQGYAETIRRVTSGPRTTAPSHAPAGEPIAGPHAILEAIRAGRNVRRLYVSEDRSLRTGAVNDLITEAQQRRIFVRYVDKMEIARLSPVENHQGVVAIAEFRGPAPVGGGRWRRRGRHPASPRGRYDPRRREDERRRERAFACRRRRESQAGDRRAQGKGHLGRRYRRERRPSLRRGRLP